MLSLLVELSTLWRFVSFPRSLVSMGSDGHPLQSKGPATPAESMIKRGQEHDGAEDRHFTWVVIIASRVSTLEGAGDRRLAADGNSDSGMAFQHADSGKLIGYDAHFQYPGLGLIYPTISCRQAPHLHLPCCRRKGAPGAPAPSSRMGSLRT